MDYLQQVENSILTTFADSIWQPFLLAIDRYQLVCNGDHIAVCISGGKDSMLLAKLMQMYKERSDKDFDLTFLVMDPGYNPANRQRIEDNAKLLDIPVDIFESDIFAVADNVAKSPCYLCARMRRGHLYAKAREHGCNKIALGHHFSDVIETTLIGMFYGSQLQAMLPKLHSTNFDGMELVRPLYCVHEDDVIAWCNANDLHFIQCACRFTERVHGADGMGVGESKRQEMKLLIKSLKQTNPNIEQSMFDSIHNVDLDTIVAYKSDGTEHSFLERI